MKLVRDLDNHRVFILTVEEVLQHPSSYGEDLVRWASRMFKSNGIPTVP